MLRSRSGWIVLAGLVFETLSLELAFACDVWVVHVGKIETLVIIGLHLLQLVVWWHVVLPSTGEQSGDPDAPKSPWLYQTLGQTRSETGS